MFKKRIIRVEFVEAGTEKVIGYDEQQVKKLPKTFEFLTKVEIEGKEYQVVKAEPDTRKKFKKAGKLLIHLEPVKETAAASAVQEEDSIEEAVVYASSLPSGRVYQSPSKPDLFPAFTGQKEGKELFEMGSWEWRRLEFLPAARKEEIEAELSQIAEVQSKHRREENGRTVYSKQHRRSVPGRGLVESKLNMSGVKNQHFPFWTAYEGLSFMGGEGFADGGFAFRSTSNLVIYGLAFDEEVQVMGMALGQAVEEGELQAIGQFMAADQLLVVDWERGILEDLDGLRAYIADVGGGVESAVEEAVDQSAIGLASEALVEEGMGLMDDLGGVLGADEEGVDRESTDLDISTDEIAAELGEVDAGGDSGLEDDAAVESFEGAVEMPAAEETVEAVAESSSVEGAVEAAVESAPVAESVESVVETPAVAETVAAGMESASVEGTVEAAIETSSVEESIEAAVETPSSKEDE